MKTIAYRYLIKEQLVPFAISFLGLSLVLITGRLMQLTTYLFTSSLTFFDLLEIIAYALPKLILYILPMATLTGIVLAFIRLNNDNELVAFRAAGISFVQLSPPVLTLLFLITLSSYFNVLFVMPTSNKAFKSKILSVGQTSLPAFLKEGVFIDSVPDLVFFFKKVNISKLSIEGIFIQDKRNPDVNMTIVGDRAQITYQQNFSHLNFHVSNGVITRIGKDGSNAQAVSFKAYELSLALDELLGSSSKGSRGRTEMTIPELRKEIRKRTADGNLESAYRFALELNQRLALPMSCLLLGLVAVPLGSLFHQRSRLSGVTLALAVFLAYYLLLSGGKGLGEAGIIPPAVAVWIPNALILMLAVYLWVKLQRGTPIVSFSTFQRSRAGWQNLKKFLRISEHKA